MDASTVAAVVAMIALVLNLLVQVTGGGWKLGQRLADLEANLRKALMEATQEIEVRQDTMLRQMGETVAAVRQKIHDVELDAAKHYIRRDSFFAVKAELSGEIKVMSDRLEARMERLEEKFDERQEHDRGK